VTRRKLLIAGLVVAVVVAGGIVLVISKRSSDCDIVRSMIAHNNQFNEHVDSAASIGSEPGIGEYRDWASQLSHLAEQVRDPELAERATTMANLAEEAVPVVEQFLVDGAPDPTQASAPPQYLQDYSRIGPQFSTNSGNP
jgi:hypothetical protein